MNPYPMEIVAEVLNRSSFASDQQLKFIAKNYDEWPVDQSTIQTFSHNGDCWKLEAKRVEKWSYEIQLRLVTMSTANLNTRMARIWCLEGNPNGNQTKIAKFINNSGDKVSHTVRVRYNLPSKDLTIVVQLITGVLELESPSTAVAEPPKSQMASVVLKWLETEDFGDTTVVAADGKKFRCHRDILSTRSEVFGRMFNTPMKESRENLVNIDGYEGDIVASLLQFVYSDDVGEIGPFADRLYVAADHYELDRLKILCESAMIANFSADSIVKTYRLAKLYHLDKLTTVCVDYWDSHKAEMSMAELLAVSLEIQ